MIKFYKNTRQQPKLKRLSSFAHHSWVYVQTPSEKELGELSTLLHIPVDVLGDAMDLYELPRLKYYGSNLVLIVRVPLKGSSSSATAPLTIILNEKSVVTISTAKLNLLDDIVKQRIPVVTTQQSQFIIQVGLQIIEEYEKDIATITKRIQKEKAQLEKVSQKEVINLVSTEEVLNDYVSALSPTIHVFKKLLHGNYIDVYKEDKDLIDDLLIDAEQVLQNSATSLKTIRNIRDGYTTVLSIRQNQILKLLTYITAIFTIPMVLASWYGMNIDLPLAGSQYAFFILFAGTILLMALAVGGFILLRKRF